MQRDKWLPPRPCYLKCNVDTSFSEVNGKTSFGMCIIEEHGQFFLAKADWIPCCLPILEGEATALQWVHSLNLHNAIFEVDCKVVAQKEDLSELGVVTLLL